MTALSRRAFGSALLTAPVAAGAVLTGAKASAGGHAGAPALFSAPLGSYTITALFDGMAPLGRGFFFGPDQGAIDAAVADAGLGPDLLPAPVSAFLLQSADRTILIDAGMGALDILGPGFGKMTDGLAALGVAADAVDTILLTHAHPDHLGGLLADGAASFPNAELVLSEVEAGFWGDAGMMAQAPAEAQGLFQLAQGTLAAYGARVTLVADGAEVAPGITARLSPGHTPGHSLFQIDGGDRQLLMIADTMHSADLHTAMPDTGFGFDVDPGLAAQSRARLFDEVSADKTVIAGSHVHFPGFGRILRSGDTYRYAAASWL